VVTSRTRDLAALAGGRRTRDTTDFRFTSQRSQGLPHRVSRPGSPEGVPLGAFSASRKATPSIRSKSPRSPGRSQTAGWLDRTKTVPAWRMGCLSPRRTTSPRRSGGDVLRLCTLACDGHLSLGTATSYSSPRKGSLSRPPLKKDGSVRRRRDPSASNASEAERSFALISTISPSIPKIRRHRNHRRLA
jgi:hypothetical protein